MFSWGGVYIGGCKWSDQMYKLCTSCIGIHRIHTSLCLYIKFHKILKTSTCTFSGEKSDRLNMDVW